MIVFSKMFWQKPFEKYYKWDIEKNGIAYSTAHTHSKNKLEVELDLSNYAKKSDFKNVRGVDTSHFANKADLDSLISDTDKIWKVTNDLSSLKGKADKLDIDKLETTSFNVSNLSDVVKNEVVKMTEYDEYVKNVNSIETSTFIKKQIMILRSTRLKAKLPSITGLATTAALNDVKIPDISETDYDAKILNVESNIFPHLIKKKKKIVDKHDFLDLW